MRLAAFALILAAAFGAAAAFGRAVGPFEREAAEADHAEAAPAASLPGLAVAQDGFRLVAARTRFVAGRPQLFVFRIEGARAFDSSHERRMHLIVVRRDLAGFQHLHPARRADGEWAVPLRLPAGGVYRAFADFVVDGRKLTLGVDLFAAGPARRLPPADPGVPVTLERDGPRIVFGWMVQPIPKWRPYERADELLAVLEVESQLSVDWYDLGPAHVYVALRSAEEVAALRPDFGRLLDFDAGINCFAPLDGRWKTRMFAPGHGVAEDPATGSAAGPLAVHLLRHGRIEAEAEIEIEQGAELQRPSRLFARVFGSSERLERVEVGGSAVVVARGEFRF
jgi:trans-2,3-dihydro-3-hydroxyanthranilate isomerase